MPFSPADIERVRSHPFLASSEFHAELASTNDHALASAGEVDLPTPRLIVAERQTAGRGRGANAWWAKPGSLTFSLLLDAAAHGLSSEHFPRLSLTTGLAVAEAIAAVLPAEDARVKWPNDVYLRARKASGILVETSPRKAGRLVIGIGVNVNNSFADAPDPLPRTAISLSDATERKLSLADVLIGVVDRFASCLGDLTRHAESLLDRWRSRCFLTERQVRIDSGTKQIRGLCLGIDEAGALLVRTDDGVQRCFAGVVAEFSERMNWTAPLSFNAQPEAPAFAAEKPAPPAGR